MVKVKALVNISYRGQHLAGDEFEMEEEHAKLDAAAGKVEILGRRHMKITVPDGVMEDPHAADPPEEPPPKARKGTK
jgi:hypothetical protein